MRKKPLATLPKSGTARRGWFFLGAIAGVLAVLTMAISFWDVDRKLSGAFFSQENGWWLEQEEPWYFLYRYGTVPGLVLTLGAFIAWLAGVVRPAWGSWRRYWALVALTSLIGGGVLVNGIAKPYWGRPRPAQIHEFGGEWAFRGVGLPGTPGMGQSFACGHATMGFVFVALFFFRKKSRALAYAGGAFGLVYGSMLSAARIVAGAHFLSDAVWSLGILLLTATALYFLVLKIPDHEDGQKSAASPNRARASVLLVLAVAAAAALLVRRPFYEYHRIGLELTPDIHTVEIHLKQGHEQKTVRYADSGEARVLHESLGSGLLNAKYELIRNAWVQDKTLSLSYDVKTRGHFSELNHRVTVILPRSLKGKLAVRFTGAPPSGAKSLTSSG